MERVKEMNRTQYPLTSKTSRAIPTAKGMGKRNMSSIVLLIQESAKKSLTKLANSRNSTRPSLACNTPTLNCSFAGRVSVMSSYCRLPKATPAVASARGGQSERELGKSACRDNSAYETLRDQLQKITLKIDVEGMRNGDVSEWRQRRTRKQRSDRNANLTCNASVLVQSQSTLPLQSYNTVNDGMVCRDKKLKKPLTRNEAMSKVVSNKLKAKEAKKYSGKAKVGDRQKDKTKGNKNCGKRSVQQKENIQVNKAFKTTVV
eukprot:TRINITY_DN5487_c0_g1_i4.p1 TRINITY_DN5487_c0_g1~~TRINITY_DN5487_c0_g1_i4.p1  ORF type:complete len:261 (+),score=42.48 TRINITY_DN5487_c0_g1_i4:436-1218(+)